MSKRYITNKSEDEKRNISFVPPLHWVEELLPDGFTILTKVYVYRNMEWKFFYERTNTFTLPETEKQMEVNGFYYLHY